MILKDLDLKAIERGTLRVPLSCLYRRLRKVLHTNNSVTLGYSGMSVPHVISRK